MDVTLQDFQPIDLGIPDIGQVAASADQPSWWQSTLGYVVTAAAKAKYDPTLQTGVMYQKDAAGNIVPMGVTHTASGAVGSSPAAIGGGNGLLLLLLGGLLIYKLVD